MHTVAVYYDGGIEPSLDDQIRAVAKRAGADEGGSGCIMFGALTRDLVFSVPTEDAAEQLRIHLLSLGPNAPNYRVEVFLQA